ncbi:hypothetical protein ACFWB2_12590 [Streptomyces virginiae]
MITIVNPLQAFVRGYAIGEITQQEAVRRSGVGIQEWMDAPHTSYLDKSSRADAIRPGHS